MTKDAVNQYDSTAANNTDVGGVNLGEGTGAGAMYPSDVNNAFREIMSHLKDVDAGISSMTSPDINGGTIDGATIGGASAAAGTFTTLTATGNTTLGDAAGDVTQNKGGFAAQGTGLPASGSGVEINFGLVAGEGTVQAFDRSGSAWEQLRLRGNQVAFDISGSEAMRIDSTSNVGIGTTSPAQELHVVGKARIQRSSNANLEITSDNNTGANPFAIGSNSDTFFLKNQAASGFGTGGNFIQYDEGGSLRLMGTNYIDSSGNVGIGTSSPAAKLHSSVSSSSASLVGGVNVAAFLEAATNTTLQISTGTGSSAFINLGDAADIDATRLASQNGFTQLSASGASDYLRFDAGGFTERMRITSSGNLGIGTTSPGRPLSVNGSIQFASGGVIEAGTTTLNTYIAGVEGASGRWAFATNGSERMRIDSSGNVGIGTTSPATELDVNGTLSVDSIRNSGTASTASTPTYTWGGQQALTGMYLPASNTIAFSTNATERLRINSSGNVGIGTTAPSGKLHVTTASSGVTPNTTGDELFVEGSGNSGITIGSGTSSNGRLYFGDSGNAVAGRVGYDHTDNSLYFGTNGVNERMTIDSSGNVGIGTSSPSSLLHLASTGSAILTIEADTDNVTESDNARIELSQDGGATTGHLGYGSGTNGIDVWNDYNDYVRIGTNNTERLRIVNNGVVRPATDNLQPIGGSSNRWSVVYAGTGTINTSDEREKQQIADLDDAERRVAVAIKGLVKKYKYNDAVQLKGDDARIHVGVIAQEVIAAFAAEGLDATRYALLCHDTWEAEPEEIDKNGNVINPGIKAGDRYGIRYDELLAFMIAAL